MPQPTIPDLCQEIRMTIGDEAAGLSDLDRALLDTAAADELSDIGEEAFYRLLTKVRQQHGSKPWLHSIEHLYVSDGGEDVGELYWKGNPIGSYGSLRFLYSEEGEALAQELAKRCRHLEYIGVAVGPWHLLDSAWEEYQGITAYSPVIEGREAETRLIAAQNDKFRSLAGLGIPVPFGDADIEGVVAMSPGFKALPEETQAKTLRDIREFSFPPPWSSYTTHDWGGLLRGHEFIMWKIQTLDKTLQQPSPDPANLAETARVLTISTARDPLAA